MFVAVRLSQGVDLVLVLFLLDVHGAQVLGQELLDLGDALLHGL